MTALSATGRALRLENRARELAGEAIDFVVFDALRPVDGLLERVESACQPALVRYLRARARTLEREACVAPFTDMPGRDVASARWRGYARQVSRAADALEAIHDEHRSPFR